MHSSLRWLTLGISAAAALSTVASAQSPNFEGLWKGAYTTSQADRGKQVFDVTCARCHGPSLEGANAPSLRGDRFLRAWDFKTVDSLFVKIRDTMPPNGFNSLSNQTKLDLIAFILQQNQFPTGSDELNASSRLDELAIVKKGTTELPNFVLVEVSGCLEQGAGGAWVLNHATEPALVQEKVPTENALRAAAEKPLGNGSFLLVSTARFDAGSLSRSRVEARGLIYREASENRLNLSSLQKIGSDCSK